MPFKPFIPLRPSGQISAREENRAKAALEQFGRSESGGWLSESFETPFHWQNNPEPPHIEIEITGGTNPYSWREVVRSGDESGSSRALAWQSANARVGTTTKLPAFERGGATDVPVGQVFEAVYHPPRECYLFSFGGGLAGDPDKDPPAEVNIYNSFIFNSWFAWAYTDVEVSALLSLNPLLWSSLVVNFAGVFKRPKTPKLRLRGGGSGLQPIRGILGADGGQPRDGEVVVIWNSTNISVGVSYDSGNPEYGGIVTPSGKQHDIYPRNAVILEYDGAWARWRFDTHDVFIPSGATASTGLVSQPPNLAIPFGQPGFRYLGEDGEWRAPLGGLGGLTGCIRVVRSATFNSSTCAFTATFMYLMVRDGLIIGVLGEDCVAIIPVGATCSACPGTQEYR